MEVIKNKDFTKEQCIKNDYVFDHDMLNKFCKQENCTVGLIIDGSFISDVEEYVYLTGKHVKFTQMNKESDYMFCTEYSFFIDTEFHSKVFNDVIIVSTNTDSNKIIDSYPLSHFIRLNTAKLFDKNVLQTGLYMMKEDGVSSLIDITFVGETTMEYRKIGSYGTYTVGTELDVELVKVDNIIIDIIHEKLGENK